MSAPDRRQQRDRYIAFGIRATSLLVLLLVLGMLSQLVLSALPLTGEPRLREVPASAVEPAALMTRPRQPDWVSADFPTVSWHEDSQRRVWVALNRENRVVAELQMATVGPQSWRRQSIPINDLSVRPDFIDITSGGDWLALFDRAGEYGLVPLAGRIDALPSSVAGAVPAHIAVVPMPGSRSWLLLADDRISQVHLVFDASGPRLELLRELAIEGGIRSVAVAPSGQGVLIATRAATVELWSTTAERKLGVISLTSPAVAVGWLASDQIYITGENTQRRYWQVDTVSGWVSLAQLFDAVHYEGFMAPVRMWQPGASTTGYESKLSLTPLLMGTIKAALMALILALPVAIGSAVFVGFFMPPSLRDRVKPAIELIAAFPTVVVGAVTALWLAPHLLDWLVPLVGVVLVVPAGVVLLSFVWRSHPVSRRTSHYLPRVPFILLPAIAMLIVLGLYVGELAEWWFFEGSLTDWLNAHFETPVRHRNALLVGVALGFAIVPTIFSVAEDAIHAVPKTAAAGSLALGATQWRSFRDVVLPVAFPGVLSAVMLGFGRAMGETMILLLVAGNAPVDSWSLFEGLRAISATLAIELTESSVGSVHYRVLFLAALLLFGLTFFFNTLAQLLKRYLRRRHGVEL